MKRTQKRFPRYILMINRINEEGRPIIFYDGVCGLCNRFIDFILRKDKRGNFLFAPLQGTKAMELGISLDRYHSMVLWHEGKILIKSTAALTILTQLPGIFRLTKLFLYIPGILRDFVYGFIARDRYLWFGVKEHCRVPTEEERFRFLA